MAVQYKEKHSDVRNSIMSLDWVLRLFSPMLAAQLYELKGQQGWESVHLFDPDPQKYMRSTTGRLDDDYVPKFMYSVKLPKPIVSDVLSMHCFSYFLQHYHEAKNLRWQVHKHNLQQKISHIPVSLICAQQMLTNQHANRANLKSRCSPF